ncbi:MAG: hypothetical protein WDO71_01725 [Bacteroidota bacterium]
MSDDHISSAKKTVQLKAHLNDHFKTTIFNKCQSMGQVVKRQLKQTLQKKPDADPEKSWEKPTTDRITPVCKRKL